MKAAVLALSCALCLPFAAQAADPLPRAKPEAVGMSSERLALIRKVVDAEIARDQLPGAVLAIARRGKLVHFEAYGYLDKAAGTPMPTDAIFNIASMTKPMVAVAGLQLYEQGRLLMDEPLAKYFPKFANMQVAVMDAKKETIVDSVPAARKITIQDLFRHTSGLIYGGRGTHRGAQALPGRQQPGRRRHDGRRIPRSSERAAAALPAGHGLGLWFRPRRARADHRAAHRAVARPISAGERLEAARHGRHRLRDPVRQGRRYAKALPTDPDTGRPQSLRSSTQPTKFECGGGCAASTASDYLRFALMLVNKGTLRRARACSGARRSSTCCRTSSARREEPDRQTGDPTRGDYGFGLGLAVRTTPGIVRMMGSVGDFSWPGASGTNWWADPREELVVVWMAHSPGTIRWKYRQMINALVYQAIVD